MVRRVSLFLIGVLLVSLCSPVLAAPPNFTASGFASEESVSAGSSVTITVDLTSTDATATHVFLEVRDPVFRPVHVEEFPTLSFAAGETKRLTTTWQTPLDALQGDNIIRLVVLNAERTVLYTVIDSAGKFRITEPEVDLYASSGSADQTEIFQEESIAIHTEANVAVTQNATILVDVFDPIGRKVAEHWYEDVTLTGGVPAPFDFAWTAPEDAIPGEYHVRLIYFKPDRSVLLSANSSVATFTVKEVDRRPYGIEVTSTPESVKPGETVQVNLTVTSRAASDALVDIQLYAPDGRQVLQKDWDDQSFDLGESQSYTAEWTPFPGDQGGEYTVKVGIFNPGWGILYQWEDQADHFTVDSPVQYTSSVSVPTEPVMAGTSANMDVHLTATADVDVLVYLQVLDPVGNWVYTSEQDNLHLTANQESTFRFTYRLPANAPGGTYQVRLGVFNPGWGHLYHWVDQAAYFPVVADPNAPPGGGPDPNAPPPPAPEALPDHFGVGLSAFNSRQGLTGWMPESGIPWDYGYQYLVGGVNTGGGWATWSPNGTFVTDYAANADKIGAIPVFTYYQLLHSNGACNGCGEMQRDLSNLNNAEVMRQYYEDFALLMKRLGSGEHDGVQGFGKTAIVHVEPDLAGYANAAALLNSLCSGFCDDQGNDPTLLRAAVSSTGLPELEGLPDNFQGFNHALLRLRDMYAPNVLLAYHISNFAQLQDISSANPTLDAASYGWQAGLFAGLAGVTQVPEGSSTYDLLFNDVSDRDAGYYKYVIGRPEAFWDQTNATFPNFHRWESYLQGAIQATGKPAMLWQVPIGNQYYRSMNNTVGHYQDNKVEYFFDHVDELVQTGVVGMLFGAGDNHQTTTNFDNQNDGITNPEPICTSDGWSDGRTVCSDREAIYPDDDGGYLRLRAQEYYQEPYTLP